MSLKSILALSALGITSTLARRDGQPDADYPHNLNNPYRRMLKRAITADTASAANRAFDFVIAGGGVAGLAMAARLSEWSNTTVLLIEAGNDGSEHEDGINIPGYSYLNSLGGTDYDWGYQTTDQVDALGGARSWPRGKGLGGSGATNGLYWCRGGQPDYDAWATLNPDGEQTWNWAEMQKYMNKAETFHPPTPEQTEQFSIAYDASVHGTDGPIQAAYSAYIYDAIANWIPTWINVGLPAHEIADGSTRGVTLTPSTINPSNQTRSDSKAGYIDPLPPRSNLVILTGQQVTSVIFNGSTDASGNKIASGVTFQAARGATSYSVQANKEVILSGGTVGTPQILQLSGVGPASRLQALGIESEIDLPVGYNLQDHVSYSMYWSAPDDVVTWAGLQNSADLQASELAKYRANATGMWTYINSALGYPAMSDLLSASELTSYISAVSAGLDEQVAQVTEWQALPSNVAAGLAAQYAIMRDRLSSDVGQLEILMTMLGYNGAQHQMGIQVAMQHPWSRGSIFISSTDPFTYPLINPDYYGVGWDIEIMSFGTAFARKLASTAPLNTIMLEEVRPGAAVTGDELNNFTKRNSGTEYHPLGTCSMLPRNQGGVVDTNLVVYGSSNLRVIDSSIMPLQISAHLMASTYGIAEKASDIIKQKYWAVQATPNTTTTTSGASESETTATAGQATDSAVTEQNNVKTSTSGLSNAAKIGVGVGAGVGALAALAAILFFCCMRRKRKTAPGGKGGWYEPTQQSDPYAATAAGGGQIGRDEYKEPGYPMAPFATSGNRDAFAHSRSDSMATMATAELAHHAPVRSESGFGLSDSTPYRDNSPAPAPLEMGGGGYPVAGGSDTYPRQQTYKPVKF